MMAAIFSIPGKCNLASARRERWFPLITGMIGHPNIADTIIGSSAFRAWMR